MRITGLEAAKMTRLSGLMARLLAWCSRMPIMAVDRAWCASQNRIVWSYDAVARMTAIVQTNAGVARVQTA